MSVNVESPTPAHSQPSTISPQTHEHKHTHKHRSHTPPSTHTQIRDQHTDYLFRSLTHDPVPPAARGIQIPSTTYAHTPFNIDIHCHPTADVQIPSATPVRPNRRTATHCRTHTQCDDNNHGQRRRNHQLEILLV